MKVYLFEYTFAFCSNARGRRPIELEVHQKVKFTEFTDKVVTEQTILSFSQMSKFSTMWWQQHSIYIIYNLVNSCCLSSRLPPSIRLIVGVK